MAKHKSSRYKEEWCRVRGDIHQVCRALEIPLRRNKLDFSKSPLICDAINLPAEEHLHLPRQEDSSSPACAAFFPLSSFSFLILSGVFQMNSLFWPRVYPFLWFRRLASFIFDMVTCFYGFRNRLPEPSTIMAALRCFPFCLLPAL